LMKDEDLKAMLEDFQRIVAEAKQPVNVPAPKAPIAPKAARPVIAMPAIPAVSAGSSSKTIPMAAVSSAVPEPPTPLARRNRSERRELTVAEPTPEVNRPNYEALKALFDRLNLELDENHVATRAIMQILQEKIQTKEDLKALESFLKTGRFPFEEELVTDERPLKELLKDQEVKETQLAEIEVEINNKTVLLRNTGRRGGSDDSAQLEADLKELTHQKTEVKRELRKIQDLITQKKNARGKDVRRFKSAEELLVSINYYFAQKDLPEDETPDATAVIESSMADLERGQKEGRGSRHEIANFLTLGLIKPRLTQTLQVIAERDPDLKGLEEAQINALAKLWDDPKGVKKWVSSLKGEAKRNNEVIVPTLIGHLEVAINAGSASYLNSFSLNKAMSLVENLRKVTHEYAMDKAKTISGDGVSKMKAYFDVLNTINKNTQEIEQGIVQGNMAKITARNAFIGAGWTAGAVALSSLSGAGLVLASGAIVSGATGLSSFKVEDPKKKILLRKAALRSMVAFGIAAGGMPILGLSALPALAIGGSSLLSPSLWRNREKIKSGTKKAGRAAMVTGGILRRVAGVALIFPLFHAKSAKFFGLK